MGKNRLDVFFVDLSYHLQQKYFENGWKPLCQVGGSQEIYSAGGAVTWQYAGSTRLDFFMPGYSNNGMALYQKWWQASSGWSNWYNLGMIG